MNIYVTTAVLACALIASTSAVQAKSHERVDFKKKGVTVWKVTIPSSKWLGYKAQTTVDANIKTVYKVLKDVKRSGEWVPRTKNARVIKRNNIKGTSEFYFELAMPFPIKNREVYVTAKTIYGNNGSITLATQDMPTKAAVKKGNIRITNFKGTWHLEKLGTNKTRVTMYGHADPAGSIPSWVANIFITKNPYESMLNLKKQVKKY